MIILERIRWKNILSTGNEFIEVNLKETQNTLICGPNGAGKSTIMDAICFGLYGKPYRNINKTQLVNMIVNKEAVAEVEFRTETGSYKVCRGIKPAFFKIFKNNELINQDADARDYQKVLETGILKIDYKTFCQKVIVGSANFTPFMQLSANDRRKVIEDILDIQIFTVMNGTLKEYIKKNKDDLRDIDSEIALYYGIIEKAEVHNAQMKKDNDEIILGKEAEVATLWLEINGKAAIKIVLEDKIAKIQEAMAGKKQVMEQIVSTTKEKITEELSLRKEQDNRSFFKSHDNCPTCKQAITQAHKMEMCAFNELPESTPHIAYLEEQLKKLTAKLDVFTQLERKLQEHQDDIRMATSDIALKTRMIKSIQAEIDRLHKPSAQMISVETEKAKLEDAENRKAILIEERDVQAVVAVLLKDDGIKATIIKQYIPIINKLINMYLERMEFFCKFEVDENFKETIKARHRDESSYDSFSEGEKMRIDLALLFTWREIARMRNSSSVNLLILDEVMDSSLDAAGTDEFLKIVRQLTEGNNVFIISHKSDQIGDKFDRVITFQSEKNFSKIKEAA